PNQLIAPNSPLGRWCTKGSELQLTQLALVTQHQLREQMAALIEITPLPFPLNFSALSKQVIIRASASDLALASHINSGLVGALDPSYSVGFDSGLRTNAEVKAELDQDLALTSSRVPDLASTRDLARHLALRRARGFAGTLDYARTNYRSSPTPGILYSSSPVVRDLHDRYEELKPASDTLIASIESNNLTEAITLATSLQIDTNKSLARFGRLLACLLSTAGAETRWAVRHQFCRYVICNMEYAYRWVEEG